MLLWSQIGAALNYLIYLESGKMVMSFNKCLHDHSQLKTLPGLAKSSPMWGCDMAVKLRCQIMPCQPLFWLPFSYQNSSDGVIQSWDESDVRRVYAWIYHVVSDHACPGHFSISQFRIGKQKESWDAQFITDNAYGFRSTLIKTWPLSQKFILTVNPLTSTVKSWHIFCQDLTVSFNFMVIDSQTIIAILQRCPKMACETMLLKTECTKRSGHIALASCDCYGPPWGSRCSFFKQGALALILKLSSTLIIFW